MGELLNGSNWIAVLLAVLLHECAHAVTATLLGVKVKRIGIDWRGPHIVREPGSVARSLVITLAGPLMNLSLLLFWTRFPAFGIFNLVLGVSNLLPVKNSDGLRALACLKQLRVHVQTAAPVPMAES